MVMAEARSEDKKRQTIHSKISKNTINQKWPNPSEKNSNVSKACKAFGSTEKGIGIKWRSLQGRIGRKGRMNRQTLESVIITKLMPRTKCCKERLVVARQFTINEVSKTHKRGFKKVER
ncbi:hypothetical protein FACS189472_15650 [Alphaproteobacteria bacterium]|nr:hypothetical protein FACS189472_15650 [Alphaproteobacteria bacterium]